jgi:hypothetical protein
VALVHDRIGILEMLIFAEGGKPENPEKNPRSKGINNKLNSHNTPNLGIEPEITVVSSERFAARKCTLQAVLIAVVMFLLYLKL